MSSILSGSVRLSPALGCVEPWIVSLNSFFPHFLVQFFVLILLKMSVMDSTVPSLLSEDSGRPLRSTAKRFLIDHELEISKKQGRPTTSPKRRTNYDEKNSDNGFSRDRPMSRHERDRPYTSPKKTEIKVNVITQKPINQTTRHFDDADIEFHQQYQKVKRLAQGNSNHIKHVLSSIESAYMLSISPPKITKEYIRPVSAFDSGVTFERAARGLKHDIEWLRTHNNKPLQHPQWNEQFVFAKTLTPPVLAPIAPIHQIHDNFVKSMSKYSSLGDPARDEARPVDDPWRDINLISNSSVTFGASQESGHQDTMSQTVKDSVLQAEMYDSISSEDNLSKSMKANEVWTKLLSRLHTLGMEIQYSDLFNLSILREPPQIVSSILGYTAILMGLKPDWSTVRSTLLKEAKIFQNFLREVRFFAGHFCLLINPRR